jgi:hypothetical protein
MIDTPLWLRIAMRLPLRWKHRIRSGIQRLEYWSIKLVIPDSWELCMLIENTTSPDLKAYWAKLDDLRAAWGIHDSELESYAVRGRFMEFKLKQEGRTP